MCVAACGCVRRLGVCCGGLGVCCCGLGVCCVGPGIQLPMRRPVEHWVFVALACSCGGPRWVAVVRRMGRWGGRHRTPSRAGACRRVLGASVDGWFGSVWAIVRWTVAAVVENQSHPDMDGFWGALLVWSETSLPLPL